MSRGGSSHGRLDEQKGRADPADGPSSPRSRRPSRDSSLDLEKSSHFRRRLPISGEVAVHPETTAHIRRSRRTSRDDGAHPETTAHIPRRQPTSRDDGAHPETTAHIPRRWPTSRDDGPHPETTAHIPRRRPTSREVGSHPQTTAHIRRSRRISRDGAAMFRDLRRCLEKLAPSAGVTKGGACGARFRERSAMRYLIRSTPAQRLFEPLVRGRAMVPGEGSDLHRGLTTYIERRARRHPEKPYAAVTGCSCLPPGFRRNTFATRANGRHSTTSSNRLYATGVPMSVSSRAIVCPPMITEAIARFVAEPVPEEATSGIMPATNASVVIRIGRNRSRFAQRIASARAMP